MKYLCCLLAIVALQGQAQTLLEFNKRFIESEDKWVVFQREKDSSYKYGFIYIDPEAGLTLNHEGSFRISENGTFLPSKRDSFNLKIRLQPNRVLVAWIPEAKFRELNIEPIPDWLKYYKTDTASFERLYRWGYMYNGWGLCARGLTYLERAQKLNAKSNALNTELAFSYNCLGQYEKVIPLLTSVLQDNPADAYTNKELIFAQVKLGQLENAAESCRRALIACKDTTYNAENCYNLLYTFYEKKDKTNFKLWLTETKRWARENTKLAGNIKVMEKELLNE